MATQLHALLQALDATLLTAVSNDQGVELLQTAATGPASSNRCLVQDEISRCPTKSFWMFCIARKEQYQSSAHGVKLSGHIWQ